MSDQPFVLIRPVRAAGLLFTGLLALFAVCAPFLVEVDPVVLILGGVAYSLFLALFGVGLVLALPSRIVLWWAESGTLPLLVMAVFAMAVWFDPEFIFRTPTAVLRGLQGLLWGWVLASGAVAGWGWVQYIRGRRSTSRD